MSDFPHVQPSALTNIQVHLRVCPLCVGDKRCAEYVDLERAWRNYQEGDR